MTGDLISREALMEFARNHVGHVVDCNDIARFPAVDAVPVMRCNMCRYYETNACYCSYHDDGMHWDGFCSCGAKMDEEGSDADSRNP